jgi:Ricin-type beta-trefoil lectin domain-like
MQTRALQVSALAIVLSAGLPPTLAEAQVRYELQAAHSRKCAHVQAASRDNGGRISQWTCNANQFDRVDTVRRDYFKWNKVHPRGEWFKLQAVHSNKCAQVNGASRQNGMPITQWDCVNQANVYWKQMPAGNGLYYIVNMASGKCMHVHGGGNQNAANITQWECVDQPHMKWRVSGSVRLSEPNLIPVQE